MKQTGIDPVVVHGGGPQIGAMLKRLQIPSSFIDGLRVTDAAAIEVVEMVLTGSINKQIVSGINAAGGRAVGLSGKDGNLVVARKLERMKIDPATLEQKPVDLGFVGEPETINPEVLRTIINSDLIPVVAPIGVGAKGETFNINADTVAGSVAGAMSAARLLLLTDVEGVLDKEGKLIPRLTVAEARALDRRRHDLRRHDPQDRNRDRRRRVGRQGRRHSRRAHSPCAAARTLHRARRGNHDHGRIASACCSKEKNFTRDDETGRKKIRALRAQQFSSPSHRLPVESFSAATSARCSRDWR